MVSFIFAGKHCPYQRDAKSYFLQYSSVRMGNDVISVLNKVTTEYFNISAADGALRIKTLEQERRIIKELWD